MLEITADQATERLAVECWGRVTGGLATWQATVERLWDLAMLGRALNLSPETQEPLGFLLKLAITRRDMEGAQ